MANTKKPKTQTVRMQKYGGLDYVSVTFKDCPVSEEYGPVTSALSIRGAEIAISKLIITQAYPLFGKEIKFIRKTLGLSLRKLADKLDISHPTVMQWENDLGTRPQPHYEVYLRLLFADELKVKIKNATLSFLVPHPDHVKPLEIGAA